MEKIKKIAFYKRFGLQVFLFYALIIISLIMVPRFFGKSDYKDLMDRTSAQSSLFSSCIEQLNGKDEKDWPGILDSFPGILYQQRICIFDADKNLFYDSGIMKAFEGKHFYTPTLPHPYIDWTKENDHFNPEVYIRHLRNIDIDSIEPYSYRVFRSNRNVRYDAGLDRILLYGKQLDSSGGKIYIFTLSHSLVDILIHGRALKERDLFLYGVIVLISLLLGLILSWSVTSPLKKLYQYSQDMLASKWRDTDFRALPKGGEIGEICRALQLLIRDQKNRSKNFQQFSSDIVHELKTPLSAIRSGLEVYSESNLEAEKNKVYERINKRIQQMENIMNQIHYIGNIEANIKNERCDNIVQIIDDIMYQFKGAGLNMETDPDLENCQLPVSCEKIHQILNNLIQNAVSFSPQKGSVSVIIGKKDNFLVIQVSDKGPGIPEEIFADILKRFFTFRPKNRERHSGLGLAIIEAILRGCGGRLEYENRIAGGAEFTCYLPISNHRNPV